MSTMPVPCPSELPAEAGRMQPSYKFPGRHAGESSSPEIESNSFIFTTGGEEDWGNQDNKSGDSSESWERMLIDQNVEDLDCFFKNGGHATNANATSTPIFGHQQHLDASDAPYNDVADHTNNIMGIDDQMFKDMFNTKHVPIFNTQQHVSMFNTQQHGLMSKTQNVPMFNTQNVPMFNTQRNVPMFNTRQNQMYMQPARNIEEKYFDLNSAFDYASECKECDEETLVQRILQQALHIKEMKKSMQGLEQNIHQEFQSLQDKFEQLHLVRQAMEEEGKGDTRKEKEGKGETVKAKGEERGTEKGKDLRSCQAKGLWIQVQQIISDVDNRRTASEATLLSLTPASSIFFIGQPENRNKEDSGGQPNEEPKIIINKRNCISTNPWIRRNQSAFQTKVNITSL